MIARLATVVTQVSNPVRIALLDGKSCQLGLHFVERFLVRRDYLGLLLGQSFCCGTGAGKMGGLRGAVKTELRVTSEPVPAVVGMAMNAAGVLTSACPWPTTSR